MREKEEAYRILEAALSIASTGVDEAEVSLRGGELGLVAVSDNQISPASHVARESLSVLLGRGGRRARFTTSDFSTAGITQAAQTARAELERLPAFEEGSGLPPPQSYAEVDAFDDETAGLHPLERVALAARAITAAHRGGVGVSGRVCVGRGALREDGFAGVYAVANTRGLLAYHPSTHASFEVQMAAGGREGRARQTSASVGQLDPRAMVESVLWALETRHPSAALPPGRYAAVLEPAAVSALLRILGSEVGAAQLERGTSFLAGRLGQPVFDERIHIADDFAHPDLRGAPFDVDGVARRKVVLVDGGVLREPVVAWTTSQVCAYAATGHGVEGPEGRGERAEHLVMSGGESSSEDLARELGSGVSISGLAGLELVDPATLRVTGTTAYGTFAIENGEIGAPLDDMRFEVSLLELWARVRGVGRAVPVDGVVAPSVAVDGFPLYADALSF